MTSYIFAAQLPIQDIEEHRDELEKNGVVVLRESSPMNTARFLKKLAQGEIHVYASGISAKEEIDQWDGADFSESNSKNSNCLIGLCCPECGYQKSMLIEVIGVDPDDVSILDSQMAIMEKVASGAVAGDSVFTATFFDNGSEDTASDTEWTGVFTCPHCGHQGTEDSFRCLHDL